MKLPVYPISSFYFIRGKLSSIRSGTTPTSGQSSKEPQFANLLLRNAPLKPDPDMEKRLNDPLIQYYIKVGSINSIFYFLHKAAEPFNCLEQDNLA